MKVPNTKWRIRRDSDWTTESAEDYFAGKRSLVVSLPGAFTPTCSGMHCMMTSKQKVLMKSIVFLSMTHLL